MALSSKPRVTGSSHPLPFERLSAPDFERLCLWLVQREGFTRAEHLGEAGSEGGRDVVAWKEGRRFVFQCKRVQAFTPAHARKEIEKLRKLPVDEQPDELVFVVSRAVSAEARSAIRAEWGDEETCQFWAGTELDEKVKRYPDLVQEFFQLPTVRRKASLPHNLPFSSLGPLFQGREPMVILLRERLTQTPAGQAMAIAGKAVHGLGGVGKTRLAVEYAWRYAADYTALLFAGAESPADLRRNLAALCDRTILDLPEREAKEEEIKEAAVLRWLGDQPGWLLILDNVDSEDAAEAVDALVAKLHGGHVLLTGRLARWSAEVEEIELDVLMEADAAEFLLTRTKGKRRPTPEDEGLAVALARELGFLPLALEQAGAYIAERRLTFAAYLEEWHSKHEQVLGWFDPRVSHYPASIAVTWQTSFDRLSASARHLLELLAWLGPEPIPETLLNIHAGTRLNFFAWFLRRLFRGLSLRKSRETRSDILIELASYSLVTRDGEMATFTVHRLIQDVTRCNLRNKSESKSIETLRIALCWVNAAFMGDPRDIRSWLTLAPLVPHARVVVKHAGLYGITEPTVSLMINLAAMLAAKSLISEAEPLLVQVVTILEANSVENNPKLATALNDLALLFHATSRFEEAETPMRRALKIDENYFGSKHPVVARDLNNLASLLQDMDRLHEAELLMRRAIAIQESYSGSRQVKIAESVSNLAALLLVTKRFSEAEQLMARLVTTFEGRHGKDHPNVATALNNLAALFKTTNRHTEAESLMRRVLAIDEKNFGPQHPRVGIDLNNLAVLLSDTNRLIEAEPLIRRAINILVDFSRRNGHYHPHLRSAFHIYSLLLKKLGKSDEEIKTTLEALAQFSE
jgi:tetratricopeptide (TPR) repeat protein